MKPKLKDVAEKAGVSPTTASMILSQKGSFPAETVEKVENAAKLLSYKKRNSRSQKNSVERVKNIGLLFYIDFSWTYVFGYLQPIFEQIEIHLNEKNCNLVLIPILRTQTADEIFHKIQNTNVDGVFSVHYENKQIFEMLEKSDIPLIVILISSLQSEFFTVCPDDFQGAYEGALHLIKLGHRSIAYIESSKVQGSTLIADRFVGFKKAVDEFDLVFPETFRIHYRLNDLEELEEKIQSIMTGSNRPTALFVLDDYIALRVLKVLQKMNIRVPEDMSIIAPGDTLDYSQPTTPQLSTIQTDTVTMGRLSANLMIDRLAGRIDGLQTLKVKPRIVTRETSRQK